MKEISVKKGEILQKKGVLNSKVFVVKEGLLRSYSIDKKGKEHIFIFAPEGWTVADNIAPDVPTELYVDALEDSLVYVIDPKEPAGAPNPETLIKRVFVLQKRVLMLMSATAIERYEHFIQPYPDILQRVSQKMIASYLGITPEALSKVKSQQHKKLK